MKLLKKTTIKQISRCPVWKMPNACSETETKFLKLKSATGLQTADTYEKAKIDRVQLDRGQNNGKSDC